MDATVSHLAGPAITFACKNPRHVPRIIQRCSVCGQVLIDNIRQAAPLNEDGTPPKTPTWEVGRFIQVTPGNPTEYRMLEDDSDKLPADSCLELVEA
jgi:hypothetical protein